MVCDYELRKKELLPLQYSSISIVIMKLKIDNEALAEEFFEESVLLGIVAPVKDYTFCWHLNQMLGFNFRINTDLEIQLTKRKRTYFFSVYEYTLQSIALSHFLYNNQFEIGRAHV